MARSKEDGRMTKQNARAFRRNIESLHAGMQSQIDQLKQKSSDDAGKIAEMTKTALNLEEKFNELAKIVGGVESRVCKVESKTSDINADLNNLIAASVSPPPVEEKPFSDKQEEDTEAPIPAKKSKKKSS